MLPDDPRHGTRLGYHLHLADDETACFPCLVASANYAAEVRRLKAYGRWQPFVPAEPVRQHVRNLMSSGMPLRDIAKGVGVRPSRVSDLLYDSDKNRAPRKIRPDYAAQLLSLEPITARVDSIGATRRLQALVAIGHGSEVIARELGVSVARANYLVLGRGATIMRTTHERIDELFKRLSMVPPDPKTAKERHAHSRALNTAQRNGYIKPLAWENIDDPDEQPVDWAYEAGTVQSTRGDTLRELVDAGANISEAARRLHSSRETLQKWCERNNLSALYLTLTSREQRTGNGHAEEVA